MRMEVSPTPSEECQQEAFLSRFALCLGTKTTRTGNTILQCLSPSVADNDVVCTLPSLDMPSSSSSNEEEDSSLLPEVGAHHSTEKVPEMAASVLSASAAASSNAAKMEQVAATQLGSLTSWTKSSLLYAPHAVNKNVSGAFSSLMDSRVKAWTLLLLRHSLSTGDAASRSRLLGMLSCSITLQNSSTNFTTLQLPESARGQPKEADAILPLLFEAELQLSIYDKVDTVSLRAPGTIAGTFAKDAGLTQVDVRLDTGALLESMVEQARLAVFKAVARATSVSTEPALSKPAAPPKPAAPSPLSQFSSALSLSTKGSSTTTTQSLLKAQSSALRLSNVLHDKASKDLSTPLGKTRKQRSVQWNHPVEISQGGSPSAKRQRMGKLKSTKSFGRPHAIQGNEPRNATFGSFGRPDAVTWGKDGKLKNHPVPGGGMVSRMSAFHNTPPPQHQNATFDLSRKASASRVSREALGLPTVGESSGGSSTSSASSMPRTATALESWLVANATKGSTDMML